MSGDGSSARDPGVRGEEAELKGSSSPQDSGAKVGEASTLHQVDQPITMVAGVGGIDNNENEEEDHHDEVLAAHREIVQEDQEWEKNWLDFLDKKGIPHPLKIPGLCGKPVRPILLFQEVLKHGGIKMCLKKKVMKQVVSSIQTGTNNENFRSTVHRMKRFYWRYLYDLELKHRNCKNEKEDGDEGPGFSPQKLKDENHGSSSMDQDSNAAEHKVKRCTRIQPQEDAETELTPERQEWLQQWRDHMKVSGQSSVVPYMAGRKLDIFQLHGIVTNMGGMDEVTKNRRWREVCRIMNLPESASGTLKFHYFRLLFRFHGAVHEADNETDAVLDESVLEDESWNDGMPDTNFLLQSCVNKSRKLTKDGKSLEEQVDKILCLIESLPQNDFSYSDTLVEMYSRDLNVVDQSNVGQTSASFLAKFHEFEEFSNVLGRKTSQLKKKVEKEVQEFQKGGEKRCQASAPGSSGRSQESEGSNKREMIPLFRDGPNLYCEGDCVILNSEGSDTPFIAQLLAYDRKSDFLHVRWLYKCEEVQKTNRSALYHYRKRHVPDHDVAYTKPAWNAEHEVFFSLHMDKDVHRNTVLGLVTVYFTEGNPIDPHKYLRSGEYYCRAVWDPSEEHVFHFSENDFKESMRTAIDEELVFSPYPYPLTSSFSSIFGHDETGEADTMSSSMRYLHSNSEVKDEWLKEAGAQVSERVLECVQHRKYRRVEVRAIAKAMAMEDELDDCCFSSEDEAAFVDKKTSRCPPAGCVFDSVPSGHTPQPKPKVQERWKALESSEPSMCTDFDAWHETMRQMWNAMLERKGARREPPKVTRPQRLSSTSRRPPTLESHDSQVDSRCLELVASFDAQRFALTVDKKAMDQLPPGWDLRVDNPIFSPGGPLPATSFNSPEGESFDSLTALMRKFHKSAEQGAHKQQVSQLVAPFLRVQMSMATTELYDGSQPGVRSLFETLTRRCEGEEESGRDTLDSLVDIIQQLKARKTSLEESCRDAQSLHGELLCRNRQLKESMSLPRTKFVFQEKQIGESCKMKQPEYHLKTLSDGRTVKVYHSPLRAETSRDRLVTLRQHILNGRTAIDVNVDKFKQTTRSQEPKGEMKGSEYPKLKKRLVPKDKSSDDDRATEMLDAVNSPGGGDGAVADDSDFFPLPAESLGDRIRRRVFHEASSSYKTIEGKIVGVLPSKLSGFRDSHTGKPAALWRIRYDEGELAEDLEFREVLEGIMAYRLASSPSSVKEFIDKKILSDADDSEKHEWVGMRVRRAVLDENEKPLGFADGTIKQCISYSDTSADSQGARMFRVVYDIPEIGCEDLKEEEAKQAIEAFLKLPDARADSFAHNGDLYVGRRIRRKGFVKLGVDQGQADGYVAEWLQSDFCRLGKRKKCSSCLWKVVYDRKELEFDYLNEFQVKEAIMIHELAEGKRPEDGTEDWFTFGCKHIGKRVRRIVVLEGKEKARKVDGTVRGWLPATVSNYFRNDDPSDPRALWRVKYDDEDIGEEDLELSELEEAIEVYHTDTIVKPNGQEKEEERADLTGQRVRKFFATSHGEQSVDGIVAGPVRKEAKPTDFGGEGRSKSPLWTVKYEDGFGTEHLEESQVLKAVELFNQKDATAKVEENAEDAEKQEAAEDSDTHEWYTTGSSYIGKMIRRSVTDSEGNNPMECNAEVIAWLPASESNFFIDDDVTKPAALWRVRFQELGCADLEEHEILEGLELYDQNQEQEVKQDKEEMASNDSPEKGSDREEGSDSEKEGNDQETRKSRRQAKRKSSLSNGEGASKAEGAKRLKSDSSSNVQ